MLEAIVLSFSIVPIDGVPDFAWTAAEISSVVALSFRIGVPVAAPFLILAFVFNHGLALVNRAMPPLQFFFVGLPFLLAFGIADPAVFLSQSLPPALAGLFPWVG